MPGPALSHLAAAGIAGTQKKNFRFFIHDVSYVQTIT
jgi:hypothetical protein